MTAPFDPAVAELVKGSHKVTAALTATTPGQPAVTLSLIGGRISWAEDRAPRVSATFRCALPDDAALLQLLDPRLRVRLALTITYTLPSGATSSAVVANLGLRDRRVVRPDAVVELEAASDEALVIDASGPAAYSDPRPALVTYADGPGWMATNISQSLAWLGGPDATVDRSAAPAASAQWDPAYSDQWDAIVDMADQLNLDVFDPGDRVFRIAPRPTVAGTSVFTVTTGSTGTLLSSDSGLGRDNWANFVTVAYEWSSSAGVPQRIWGTARVTSGPYKADTIGYKSLSERRDTATTQAAANKVAAAILGKLLSRSRTQTATTVAAWWVRPGHTVTIDLPLSSPAQHIVSWVDYDIDDMTMTLGTRLPDTASTIGE